MRFFHKPITDTVLENEREAKKLKEQIIKPTIRVERDAARLNKLLLADGITLKIFYATGGDRRRG